MCLPWGIQSICPPKFQVAAGTANNESVTLELDGFTDLSPMKSPLKRSSEYISDDNKKAAQFVQTEAEPTALNFEGDTLNFDIDNKDTYKDDVMDSEEESDDNLSEDCSVSNVPGISRY